MKAEVEELLRQKTWTISLLPKDRIALGGRWVYKIKTDNLNNIIKYKSRWVIQGYNQVLGLDYNETFATTARPETIRILFIIAIANSYIVQQYDIKNAFVHADIDEEIYTVFPKGYTKLILLHFLEEIKKRHITSYFGITKRIYMII